MRPQLVLVLTASALGACSPGAEQTPDQVGAAGEWATLFDGSSLAGWAQVGDANWQLMDGAVAADSGTGFLLTAASYADFDLELEFWVTPDANSGVFIRCANPNEIGAAMCYEVNIFDKRPDPSYRTGAIVNIAKPKVMVDAANKWNTMEITAKGPRMTVVMNGMQTVDVEDRTHARGPIALQYGTGTVKFRNVQIR